MSPTDWNPERTKREAEAAALPPSYRLPKALPYRDLPADVRALLEQPERPRATHRGEAYQYGDQRSIAGVAKYNAEYSKHEVDTNELRGQDDEMTRRAEWQCRQLRALGYDPGPAVSTASGETVYSNSYARMIDQALFDYLTAEADDYARRAAAEEVDEERDAALAVIPDQGAGAADIEKAWGKSRSATKRALDDFEADGRIRVEEIPSSRGGRPKKLYFRADPDGDSEA